MKVVTLRSGKKLNELDAMKKNKEKENVTKKKQGEKVKKLEEEVRLRIIHFSNNSLSYVPLVPYL